MSKRTLVAPNVAYITAAVMTWAIDQSGRSREDLADAVDATINDLAEWESGKSLPTFDQAVQIADCLGIPLGYLFLSTPPKRKVQVPDKRTLDGGAPLSANFRQLLSDVLVRQEWYRQHVLDAGGKPLSFIGSATSSDDVQLVAADIRKVIKLSPEDRRNGVYSWSDYLTRLSERAEGARILVMRSGVVGNTTRTIERTEVQGFALADPIAPVVYVNSSDFVAARIFTLAHEIAHLWLGQSAITNPDQGEAPLDATETFCNRVATEVLLPQRAFPTVWKQTPPNDRVNALVRKYWVSARVVLRRARELGLIGVDEYLALREEALAAESAKPRKVTPDYYRTAVARAGRRLTNAVVSEVAKGAIPITEGASLMSMSINTFAEFAEGRQ